MKKVLSVMLVIVMLFSFAACGEKSVEQDSSPLTMTIGNGGGQAYLVALQKAVKRDLNIDIKFIYEYSADTTNSLVQEFKNNDLSADIMVTSSTVNNEYLENTCLDYLTCSHLSDYFTFSKIKEYSDDKGSLYQLPFTSKLIGVTYNKTLMQEMGWDVPNNYNEMVELKKKCDENNILFAVTGGMAAGHGFNWLFHLMGSDWLSTLDGTEWFEKYLKGEATVDDFKEEAQYFKKYFESGLFGYFYTESWESSYYYREQRALINYDLTNGLSKALRLNEDGTVYGAEYNEKGEINAVKNNSGAYVLINNNWTVYDENNAIHQDIQRYDIPGASIDEFASMPWISEDGTNNRFTCYDNMFVMLNKNLGEENKQDKLAKALKVLEYMCSEDVTKIFSNEALDGYVAVNDFKITEDRLYYKFADKIEAGYIQPWYYTFVDINTLCNTGYAVNDYMSGGETTFDDIINILDENVKDNLNNVSKAITTVSQTLTYEELAKLDAIVSAQDLQNKLDENGIDKEITVSLMPYTENRGDMAPWSIDYLGIVSTKLYAGELEEAIVNTIVPAKAANAKAIEMTGTQLNRIINYKLNNSDGGKNYDDSYGPYPYAVVTKDGEPIDENKTYIVCVNELSLNQSDYQSFVDGGKVIVDKENNIISGDLKAAIIEYFKANPQTSPENIIWK